MRGRKWVPRTWWIESGSNRSESSRNGKLISRGRALVLFDDYQQTHPYSRGRLSFNRFFAVIQQCGPRSSPTHISTELRGDGRYVSRRSVRNILLETGLRTQEEIDRIAKENEARTKMVVKRKGSAHQGQSTAKGPLREKIVGLLHNRELTMQKIASQLQVRYGSIVRVNREEGGIRKTGYGSGKRKTAQERRRTFVRRALKSTRVPYSRIAKRVVKREGLKPKDEKSARVFIGVVKKQEKIKRPQFKATKQNRQRAIDAFWRVAQGKRKEISYLKASKELGLPIYFLRKVFRSQMLLWTEQLIERDRHDLHELREITGMPLSQLKIIQKRVWRKNGWD